MLLPNTATYRDFRHRSLKDLAFEGSLNSERGRGEQRSWLIYMCT